MKKMPATTPLAAHEIGFSCGFEVRGGVKIKALKFRLITALGTALQWALGTALGTASWSALQSALGTASGSW
jgi:hypothetical protein